MPPMKENRWWSASSKPATSSAGKEDAPLDDDDAAVVEEPDGDGAFDISDEPEVFGGAEPAPRGGRYRPAFQVAMVGLTELNYGWRGRRGAG